MRMAKPLLLVLLSAALCAQPTMIEIYQGTQSSYPEGFTELGGIAYFRAYNASSQKDVLYRSDGTAAGTYMLKDIMVSLSGYPEQSLTVINNKLIFSAYQPATGYELWVSDGTSAGTVLLKDIMSGSGSSYPEYFAVVDNQVFFQVHNINYDLELWVSDGTASGTYKVTAIEPAYSNKPPNFCGCNGLLFFNSQDSINGQELWRSDGTAAGTFMVKDIHPGTGSSVDFFSRHTCFEDKLFFSADDGGNGAQVWVSDGTAAGTKMLKYIKGDYSGADPLEFTVSGNKLYFSATHEVFGRELFVTDGTSSGTTITSNLASGSDDGVSFYSPGEIAGGSGSVFFKGYTLQHGWELMRSDGTLQGTGLLVDIIPGNSGFSANSSRPRNITVLNGRVFFTASNNYTNQELWKVDQSGANLQQFDLNPSGSSYPMNLKTIGGKLFFSANDGSNGRELWVYEPSKTEVTGFTLVDAVTNQDIMPLKENDVINLAALPHKKVNIRADLKNGNQNTSVQFFLDGILTRTENVAPYALAGDNPPGNYAHWTPGTGEYRLKAIPYSGANANGELGLGKEISFIVVDVSFGVTHLTLVDAENDTDILNFRVGRYPQGSYPNDLQIVDLSSMALPDEINIRANTYPPDMDEVSFGLDGDDYAWSEKATPFALFGDKNGDYRSWYDQYPFKDRAISGSHYLVIWADKGSQTDVSDSYFRLDYNNTEVAEYALVDAVNDEVIQTISENQTIDLAYLPTNRLNIVAYTIPEQTGSVAFDFKRTSPFKRGFGERDHEDLAPYALFGDISGDYQEWVAENGTYELTARPFTEELIYNNQWHGVYGKGLTRTFTIVNSWSQKNSLTNQSAPEQGLNVYPNPSSGIINLSYDDPEYEGSVVIRVISMSGQELIRKEVRKSVGSEILLSLDLSGYTAGVYQLRLECGDKIYHTALMLDK